MVLVNSDPLFDFPTIFRLRVIGENSADFADFILEKVSEHIPSVTTENIQSQLSDGGKYLAVIVSFIAESRSQLDEVYRELSASDRVKFLL